MDLKDLNPFKTKLPVVNSSGTYLGCDPEFFFVKNKVIIGAEKILPKEGYMVSASKFIIDGVQAELNPAPNTCRANMGNEIKRCFLGLNTLLSKHPGVTADFSRSVTITDEEFATLNPENQRFGCTPSFNAYQDTAGMLNNTDPMTHRQRSAGGHIHIGMAGAARLTEVIKAHPEKFVELLDIVVGNTCVLLDRDEGNVIRRKLYGRAGEYRLPPHGLEYRTLSNFWLTAYQLTSLVFGMVRMCVSMIQNDQHQKVDFHAAFKAVVNMDDIRKAINENDFDLAYKNYKAIQPLLKQVSSGMREAYGYDGGMQEEFEHFFMMIKEHGLEYWFKEEPMTHWCNLPEAHGPGFANFLAMTLQPALRKLKGPPAAPEPAPKMAEAPKAKVIEKKLEYITPDEMVENTSAEKKRMEMEEKEKDPPLFRERGMSMKLNADEEEDLE